MVYVCVRMYACITLGKPVFDKTVDGLCGMHKYIMHGSW